ncbi:hypothetical protein HDU67_003785, partial [Dinochytrium kinnereticum]
GKLRVELEELKGLLEAAGSEKENLRSDKVKLLRETEALKGERNHLVERSTELEKRLRMLERATNEEVEAWRKALKEENDTMKEERIKLTRELELFKARHVELEGKVKAMRKQLEESPSADELSRLTLAMKTLSSEREALQIVADSSQSTLQGLRKEMITVTKDRDALADKISKQATSPSTNDLTLEQLAMNELVSTLRLQCDELAKQAQMWKQEAETAKMSADSNKHLASIDDLTRAQIADLEVQLNLTSDRLKREKETWRMKEQTLYKEIERLHLEYMGMTKEVTATRKMILESRVAAGGLPQNIVKPEDVSVQDWVRNIVSAYKKQQTDLVEAHTILDLQHEKLEDAIARSSLSVESLAQFDPTGERGLVPRKMVDQEIQTDQLTSFIRMSTIKAALSRGNSTVQSGPRSRSSSNASSAGARGRSAARSPNDGDPGSPLPAEWATITSPEEEALRTSLSKVTSKYASLQQQHAAIASQLDHQLRANAEIKRLIVGSAMGRSVDGTLLERYNDAMLEVGALRTEMERWRSRCEEVEEVVEQVFMKQMEVLPEEGEVTPDTEADQERG